MYDQELYNQLAYYTLSLQDIYFIHQLVVDAFAAQNFQFKDKPIKIVFSLVGLYLVNEKEFTGKQVQNTHMALAKANQSRTWPVFLKPAEEAELSIEDVLKVPDDRKEDMIKRWSQSVWSVWKPQEEKVVEVLSCLR